MEIAGGQLVSIEETSVDLYAPELELAEPLTFRTSLAAGVRELSFDIMGSNEMAAPYFRLGLDYVRLI